jgi:hypothetical protein
MEVIEAQIAIGMGDGEAHLIGVHVEVASRIGELEFEEFL